jgi:hypothetical protein
MLPMQLRATARAYDQTLELPLFLPRKPTRAPLQRSLADDLVAFREFGQPTRVDVTRFQDSTGKAFETPTFINEFWTAKQRQAHSLHEISYRACFKPQLPRFFIERLTQPGDLVYDPFMGRGTTLLEAALLGRLPAGCDVNPLSTILVSPRLDPPQLSEISRRLDEIDFHTASVDPADDLLVFYHPETLRQILSLRAYLLKRRTGNQLDAVDDWICAVAVNRLTGHSSGFFSVYTLPPNQAVSVKSQRKINHDRHQTPPQRNVSAIILKKSRQLLRDCSSDTRASLHAVRPRAALLTGPSACTPQLAAKSVSLALTSPPFLNVVDYATDNWLRCWFVGIDASAVKLTVPKKLDQWRAAMTAVLRELHRVLKPGGRVAFEVGEVHGGATRLEETVLPAGLDAGLTPLLVLINDQKFTKTANCWGVDNNRRGTNTNRIVVFRK